MGLVCLVFLHIQKQSKYQANHSFLSGTNFLAQIMHRGVLSSGAARHCTQYAPGDVTHTTQIDHYVAKAV